ncbi:MAG: hypothetical protein IT460_13725 [Planctomycetes bacterium]|nr:hypothetical protein [Planctomycetota bacterium]
MSELRVEACGEARRACARVVWEDARRPDVTPWIDTDGAPAADLEAAPEAFLVALAPVALAAGERRLALEATVDPVALEGARRAVAQLRAWDARLAPLALEAASTAPRAPRRGRRSALFLSGGVDSLSLLRRNRLDVAVGAPGAFEDGVFVFGLGSFDLEGDAPHPARLRAFQAQRARLERLARTTSLGLVAVRTNLRTFHPSWAAWRDLGFGAALAAVAHALPSRWTDVAVASGGVRGAMPPHASHPALDPCWSSGAVAIVHGEPGRARMDKLRDVAAWDEALDALQVCLHHDVPPPDGRANCGRCEKCLRTRLGLLALGRLPRATTLPGAPTREELAAYRPAYEDVTGYAADLAAALDAAGRPAEAALVRRAVAREARRARRHASTWHRWWRALRRRRGPAAGPV